MGRLDDLKIAALRRDLTADYYTYRRLRGEVDCGIELHKTMSAEFSELCRRLNATLDALAKLDPNAPQTRF